MEIDTRPATDADTEFARDVHHAAYRAIVVRQFGPWDDEDQDRRFLGDWEAGPFVIIQKDGMDCGYAAVEDHDDCIGIRELVIHPIHQDKGIGTEFLQHVMARARERNVPIRLGTFHMNSRAVAFYERLGFRNTGKTDMHILLEWSIKPDARDD